MNRGFAPIVGHNQRPVPSLVGKDVTFSRPIFVPEGVRLADLDAQDLIDLAREQGAIVDIRDSSRPTSDHWVSHSYPPKP